MNKKLRVLSAFLLITLFFSIFSVFALADSSTDVVKEEIEKNFTNLDLSELSGNRLMVIGAMEDITDETSLYLYLYNPQKLKISSGYLNLSCNFESSSSNKTSKNYNSIAFSIVDKSQDQTLWKVRIDLSGISSVLLTYDKIHEYTWSKIVVKYSYLFSSRENVVLQNYHWKFDYSGEQVNVSYDVTEVAELNVNQTWYRTGSTSDKKIQDEIFSVYFSIPEEYTKYYSKLYSVASSYTKKRITPAIVIDEPFNASRPLLGSSIGFLSSDYSVALDTLPIGSTYKKYIYAADYGYNLSDSLYHRYDILNRLNQTPQLVLTSSEEDFYIYVEDVFEYIEYCESNNLNRNLFESSEKIEWSEKTIDDTFDSINYINRTSLYTKYKEFGLWTAILLHHYRDNPERLQEILTENGLPNDIYSYEDEPYLVLCDDTFKAEAASMTDEELSRKALINVEDIPEFRNYLKNNDNVVIYHFDVAEYWSDTVNIGTQRTTGGFESNGEQGMLFQQYLYYDFQVIDVTFKDEDTFVSLAVNSHPIDIGSDPSYTDPNFPGITPGDVAGAITGDVKDDLKDLLERFNPSSISFRILISVAIVAVSVLAIAIGVRYIIKSFSSPDKSDKNKNKKE